MQNCPHLFNDSRDCPHVFIDPRDCNQVSHKLSVTREIFIQKVSMALWPTVIVTFQVPPAAARWRAFRKKIGYRSTQKSPMTFSSYSLAVAMETFGGGEPQV